MNRSLPGLDERGGWAGFVGMATVLLLAVALVGFILIRWFFEGQAPTASFSQPTPGPSQPSDPGLMAQQLLKAVNDRLSQLDLEKLLDQDVQKIPVTVSGNVILTYQEEFRLPARYSPQQMAGLLEDAARAQGAHSASAPQQRQAANGDLLYDIPYTFDGTWTPLTLTFNQVHAPKVCLVIDDGGYQKGEALEALYGFKVPVTVSIIPDVNFSKELAEELPGQGVEVICHMPMQGHEYVKPGSYKEYLTVGMDAGEARREVGEALDDLPNCRGLNNHMGSVAEEDSQLIGEVCDVLQQRHLFILASKTTPKSAIAQEAMDHGMAFAQRDVFLDNVVTPGAVDRQMAQLVARARKHGVAVGIGHFKTVTLTTLEAAVQRYKAEGIQFVYLSEVVKEGPQTFSEPVPVSGANE